MAQTVGDMFFRLGGYEASDTSSPAYVSAADITGTFVPWAVSYFNTLCSGTHTVSVTWTGTSGSSSGDIYDDRILAELSLYFADSQYDTLHVDPDDAERENRHLTMAKTYVLDKYGVMDRNSGKVIMPNMADDTSALASMGVATLTDDSE